MPPAARVGDMHTCPMVTPGTPPIPHVGGPVLPPGCPTVLIGGLPACDTKLVKPEAMPKVKPSQRGGGAADGERERRLGQRLISLRLRIEVAEAQLGKRHGSRALRDHDLLEHGAHPNDTDAKGTTVVALARSEWIRTLLDDR